MSSRFDNFGMPTTSSMATSSGSTPVMTPADTYELFGERDEINEKLIEVEQWALILYRLSYEDARKITPHIQQQISELERHRPNGTRKEQLDILERLTKLKKDSLVIGASQSLDKIIKERLQALSGIDMADGPKTPVLKSQGRGADFGTRPDIHIPSIHNPLTSAQTTKTTSTMPRSRYDPYDSGHPYNSGLISCTMGAGSEVDHDHLFSSRSSGPPSSTVRRAPTDWCGNSGSYQPGLQQMSWLSKHMPSAGFGSRCAIDMPVYPYSGSKSPTARYELSGFTTTAQSSSISFFEYDGPAETSLVLEGGLATIYYRHTLIEITKFDKADVASVQLSKAENALTVKAKKNEEHVFRFRSKRDATAVLNELII